MKNSQLTVEQLLIEDKYIIPRYQRNYAWERKNIEQLVKDIISAQTDDLPTYYIGIMVVSKERDAYTIIDGQQRITTLLLIALALQKKNKNGVIHINKDVLRFQSRSTSNKVLEDLIRFSKSNESKNSDVTTDEENELNRAFGNVKDILEEHLSSDDKLDKFEKYLLKKVKVFRDVMPENLDLNLYFERFNSRGKQLEAHEIIKGIFIGKLEKQSNENEKNKLSRNTFAEIWDVCSDMTTPIYFNSKEEEAKLLTILELKNKYDDLLKETESTENNDNVKPLRNILNSKRDVPSDESAENKQELEEESNEVTHVDYRSVINFSTFLLHAFHLKEGNEVKDVTLDDKKLLDIFKANQRDSDWIYEFTETLVKLRLLYDNYIIKALIDKDIEDGRKWIIDPFISDNQDKSGSNKSLDKEKQSEIRMLQAMFAETFTANSDTKWLYEVLNYLYEKVFTKKNRSNEDELDKGIKNKLREMTVSYAEDRICKDDDKSKIDENKLNFYEETEGFRKVPIYAFNFADYVLWENRDTLKEEYSKTKFKVDFDNFEFRSRKSIEHWYPQNPISHDGGSPIKLLNDFGNLALVTASHNSKLSNRLPKDKINNSYVKFENQSLKLQMMVHSTDKDGWNEDQDKIFEDMKVKIIGLLDKYIEKVNNMKDHD